MANSRVTQLYFNNPPSVIKSRHSRQTGISQKRMTMLDFLTKEFFIGLGSAAATVSMGALAFTRAWTGNRAANANSNQQIDMLERQEKYIVRMEARIEAQQTEMAKKDEVIREYAKTNNQLESRIQLMEFSLDHIKEQNRILSEQVTALTMEVRTLRGG